MLLGVDSMQTESTDLLQKTSALFALISRSNTLSNRKAHLELRGVLDGKVCVLDLKKRSSQVFTKNEVVLSTSLDYSEGVD